MSSDNHISDAKADLARAADVSKQAASQAGAAVGDAVANARDATMSAADAVKEAAANAASAARDAASHSADSLKSMAGDATAAVHDTLSSQKAAGAELVADFARNARQTAQGLQENSPQLARMVGSFADRAENFAGNMRDTSIDDMVGSVGDFARRKPIAAIGASMLVGFAIARLMSSRD